MKIYIGHASNFDYENNIYKLIENDDRLKKDKIVLPHREKNYTHNREYYQDFDLAICEVSYPSVGLGIEMAFFYDSGVPIYCLYKDKYSKAVEVVTNNIYEYHNTKEFLDKIVEIIGSR